MSQRTSRPYLGHQLESRYHSINETIIASVEDACIECGRKQGLRRHRKLAYPVFFLFFFLIHPSLST